jgi:hypothetical protein
MLMNTRGFSPENARGCRMVETTNRPIRLYLVITIGIILCKKMNQMFLKGHYEGV